MNNFRNFKLSFSFMLSRNKSLAFGQEFVYCNRLNFKWQVHYFRPKTDSFQSPSVVFKEWWDTSRIRAARVAQHEDDWGQVTTEEIFYAKYLKPTPLIKGILTCYTEKSTLENQFETESTVFSRDFTRAWEINLMVIKGTISRWVCLRFVPGSILNTFPHTQNFPWTLRR